MTMGGIPPPPTIHFFRANHDNKVMGDWQLLSHERSFFYFGGSGKKIGFRFKVFDIFDISLPQKCLILGFASISEF
jgi:hypothetical protein